MVRHFCYICNKSFSQKGHLKNHLYKKKKCNFNNITIDNKQKTIISHEDVILLFESKEYEKLFLDVDFSILDSQKTPKDSQMTPKDSQMTPKDSQNSEILIKNAKNLTKNEKKSEKIQKNQKKNVQNLEKNDFSHKNQKKNVQNLEKNDFSHKNQKKKFENVEKNEFSHKNHEKKFKNVEKNDFSHKNQKKKFENVEKNNFSHKNLEKKKKVIECEYCHMKFSRMNNKNRHIKNKRCSYFKNKLNILNDKNNGGHTTNNIIINNNTQNNININCYGKEDISYITDDVLDDIIKKPMLGIPKLIELIHLNPNHPENNNIKLVNKNLPYIDYYNGDYWKTADKSKVLGNLLKSKAEITDKYFKDIKRDDICKLYPKYSDAIKYVVNNFEFEDPLIKYKPTKKELLRIYKKLEKDLYTMILNHREFVKDICDN